MQIGKSKYCSQLNFFFSIFSESINLTSHQSIQIVMQWISFAFWGRIQAKFAVLLFTHNKGVSCTNNLFTLLSEFFCPYLWQPLQHGQFSWGSIYLSWVQDEVMRTLRCCHSDQQVSAEISLPTKDCLQIVIFYLPGKFLRGKYQFTHLLYLLILCSRITEKFLFAGVHGRT